MISLAPDVCCTFQHRISSWLYALQSLTLCEVTSCHTGISCIAQDKVPDEEQRVKMRAALQSPDNGGPGTWAGRCGVALLTAPLGWVEDAARVRTAGLNAHAATPN